MSFAVTGPPSALGTNVPRETGVVRGVAQCDTLVSVFRRVCNGSCERWANKVFTSPKFIAAFSHLTGSGCGLNYVLKLCFSFSSTLSIKLGNVTVFFFFFFCFFLFLFFFFVFFFFCFFLIKSPLYSQLYKKIILLCFCHRFHFLKGFVSFYIA